LETSSFLGDRYKKRSPCAQGRNHWGVGGVRTPPPKKKIGRTILGSASSWTNPLSPGPPRGSFLPVRPHRVSYKVTIPQLFHEECDYRYVTDCSARNWVYHPYFVQYHNIDQGIGAPNFENVVAPLPMLRDRCLVCPVCNVGVNLYCGQTAGWIKMPLSVEVGLGPGQIVLDGDPAPTPPKGHSPPNFRPISDVVKWLHGSRCHLVWR